MNIYLNIKSRPVVLIETKRQLDGDILTLRSHNLAPQRASNINLTSLLPLVIILVTQWPQWLVQFFADINVFAEMGSWCAHESVDFLAD